MDNLHLVTGYLGYDHISAVDQGAFNAALIGTGDFVLKKGNVFKAQIIDSNTVRVYDGELMMQGRFIRLEPGTYVDLAIDSGTQGMMRNDLIVVRYTKSETTGVEGVNLVVIKGTADASNPLVPDCTEGDITNGEATKHDFPLWRIHVDGLTVGTPVALFGEPYDESMRTLPAIRNQMAQLKRDIFETAAGIETGSYTGTGAATFSLYTDLNPKIIILSCPVGGGALGLNTTAYSLTIIDGVTKYLVYDNNSSEVYMTANSTYVAATDKYRIAFTAVNASGAYLTSGDYIFNKNGETYHYVIVGN